MSKLKLVNAKTMEKLLLRLGFEKVRQKEAMLFTGMLMAELPRYHTTR